MDRKEFFETAGYFANPIRNTRIEIEARQSTIDSFNTIFTTLTGTPIPIGSDSVFILPENADKWGREMRLYFKLTDHGSVPYLIGKLMTIGGRPGYDIWNQRLNSKDIIDELFAIGFTFGHPQNVGRIQGFIPTADMNNFMNGFNAH